LKGAWPGSRDRPGTKDLAMPGITLLLGALLLVSSVLLIFLHGKEAGRRLGAIAVGSPLPELVLYSPGKKGMVSLLAKIADGGPTLVVFHSDQCPVCPDAMKALREWVRQGRAEALRVILVLDAQKENVPADPDFVVLLDPALEQSRRRLRIAAVPSYLLVDDRGIVRYVQKGWVVKAGEAVLLHQLEHTLAAMGGEAHEH